MLAVETNHICLLMAMRAEAEPLITSLKLAPMIHPNYQGSPVRLYQGALKNTKVTLSLSGVDARFDADLIGPVPATLNASLACQHLQPDLIISCGTAGGFSTKDCDIGTVIVSKDKCIFHDRHVPLPGFKESGLGSFPVFDVSKMAHDLNLKMGVISSGSSLLKSASDIEVLLQHDAIAKEMEAAAIAWVCAEYQMNFIGVKSITNLLDKPEPSEDQFLRNLDFASASLAKEVIRVIEYFDKRYE